MLEEFDSIQTNLELLDDTEGNKRRELEDRFFEIIANTNKFITSDSFQNSSNTEFSQLFNLNDLFWITLII